MKLSEYLPEVPAMANQMSALNQQITELELMKSAGDTSESPMMGLDHVVNTWVRHQMAYRQQLIMDLQTIAMSLLEIRSPISHITGEVFRRGIIFKPIVENPNWEQRARLQDFLDDCNAFDQSLEEVLRQFHFDINCVDDGFIYIAKEYIDMGAEGIRSKVKEIRRLNPALVEFDLDMAGLPKNAHFICPIHREHVSDVPSPCKDSSCDRDRWPVMYKYYHRNQHIYLFDNEIIHLSKFSPSETYGWSPILTIFEKALSIIGMDKNIYRYFFERKMPASMLMVFTDDPESLRRERAHIAAQTRIDPNFVPMVAVSAKNNRGRVDMVRLFHTLQEMDYLPVRQEIRERIAAMWGVTPAWQGAPEAFGGLSTQTQQLVVMSRVVEGDQRLFHEKVFPQLLEAFGITDWRIELPQPEEKAEATRISFAQQRIQVAAQYAQLGFEVRLKDQDVPLEDAEFVISGEYVPMSKIQSEQMEAQTDMMGEQGKMMEEQMKQMKDQAEQQKEQMEQQQEQQQAQPEQQEQPEAAPGEADEEGEEGQRQPPPEEGEPIQAMLMKTIPRSQRKYKGRTGGVTPDWTMKLPGEERNIEDYAEARSKANPLTLMQGSMTWVQGLIQKGYTSPNIREVSADGKRMWFSQYGVDYVANLTGGGVTHIEKAVFNPVNTSTGMNYNPTDNQEKHKQRKQQLVNDQYPKEFLQNNEEESF